MSGRKWKNVEDSMAENIKKYLLEEGGIEGEIKSPHEAWRIKFSDSTITYYTKGTLYSTPSNSNDPAVFRAWKQVDSIVGSQYILPTRDFLIGLDETGKGEVIGHTVLTGVFFPKEVFNDIDILIGPADTKKRHTFDYWDELFKKIDFYRKYGFDFILEKVPPWRVDKYNLNKIMDVTYQRILSIFFRKVEINKCRIVLDDYGIGDTLRRFLNFLDKQGAEVIASKNSEEYYLEAKIASLISKRIREAVIKSINENPEFQLNGLSVGSGNVGNKQTIEWLKKWHDSGKDWPWFIKRSFKNIWEMEGKSKGPRKSIPPITESLLSQNFLEEFNKGKLSIEALSIICPNCGEILKSCTFANMNIGPYQRSELKCPNSKCNKFIRNSGFTLRYYCGYVIPDSSAIQRNLLSRDLGASKFFEDFTVILVPIVRIECDGTPRGKQEFDALRKFNDIGRIKLESIERVDDLPDDISGTIRDERIIESCLKYDAILLTADKSMSTFAVGKNVFTIFI